MPNRRTENKKKTLLATALGAALALAGTSVQALDIVFDYSLDTQHFFGADKRALLDQVASIFEYNLGTPLAALNNVNFLSAGLPSGTNPMTGLPSGYYAGSALNVSGLNIAANTLRVYVGAADLADNTLGLAWVGTARPNRRDTANDGFSSGWGGQLLFDTTQDLSNLYDFYGNQPYADQTRKRDWYIDGDIRSAEAMGSTLLPINPSQPAQGSWSLRQIDFASVVMHEMGHMFGLQHSANPADAMYASTSGERNFFDANDWQAMRAAGWAVNSLSPDLNQAVSVVPEPGSDALMLAGLAGIGWAARRQRRA